MTEARLVVGPWSGVASMATPLDQSLELIGEEHEQLRLSLVLAQRCATNAEHGDCAHILQRALLFLEQHSHGEEALLIRCAYAGIWDVRRSHERLTIALEQVLWALEREDTHDIVGMLGRIGDFLGNNIARDTQSMARFFVKMVPWRLLAGTG